MLQFRPGHRRVTSKKGPRKTPMRAFRLITFFPAIAGNRNAKIQLKEGTNHGYKATEHPDSLGR